jgi:hypothetical protein
MPVPPARPGSVEALLHEATGGATALRPLHPVETADTEPQTYPTGE